MAKNNNEVISIADWEKRKKWLLMREMHELKEKMHIRREKMLQLQLMVYELVIEATLRGEVLAMRNRDGKILCLRCGDLREDEFITEEILQHHDIVICDCGALIW